MAMESPPHRNLARNPGSRQPTPPRSIALPAINESNVDAAAAAKEFTINSASPSAYNKRSDIDDESCRPTSYECAHAATAFSSPGPVQRSQQTSGSVAVRLASSSSQKQNRTRRSSFQPWSKHEEEVLMAGIQRFGTHWKRVAPYFAQEAPQNHRTPNSLCQHYHLFLKSTKERRGQPQRTTPSAVARDSASGPSSSLPGAVPSMPRIDEGMARTTRSCIALEEGKIVGEEGLVRHANEAQEVGQEVSVRDPGAEEQEAQEETLVACEADASVHQEESGGRVVSGPSAPDPAQCGLYTARRVAEDATLDSLGSSCSPLQPPAPTAAPMQLTRANYRRTLARGPLDYEAITLEYGYRFEHLPPCCELSVFSPDHYRLRPITAEQQEEAQCPTQDSRAAAAAFIFHILADGWVVGINLPPRTKTHAAVVPVDEGKEGDVGRGVRAAGFVLETHFDAECGFKVIFVMPL